MTMSTTEAHDTIRWDVLYSLNGRLHELADQALVLADNLEPDPDVIRNVAGNVRTVREYLDALDVIGWHSAKAAS